MKHLHSKKLFIMILSLSVPLQSWCAADPEQTAEDRYETFKAVQNIKKILAQLTEEFKTPDSPLHDGSAWPRSNPHYYKTKQGLFLHMNGRPHRLATPWGEVILSQGDGNYIQNAAFNLAFVQKVEVQVADVPIKPRYPKDKLKWYTIREMVPTMWKEYKTSGTSYKFEDIYHQISPEEALSKIGTNCLLRGNFETATYKVIAIDGKKVPEPIDDDEGDKTTEQEWKEFEQRYKHEFDE